MRTGRKKAEVTDFGREAKNSVRKMTVDGAKSASLGQVRPKRNGVTERDIGARDSAEPRTAAVWGHPSWNPVAVKSSWMED